MQTTATTLVQTTAPLMCDVCGKLASCHFAEQTRDAIQGKWRSLCESHANEFMSLPDSMTTVPLKGMFADWK